MKIQADEIQLRRDTLQNWQLLNPILESGELICVFTTETGKPMGIKFGDGVSKFSELPWVSGEMALELIGKAEILSLLSTTEQSAKEYTDDIKQQLQTQMDTISLVSGTKVDWDAEAGTPGEILNKPTSLPASGGNADTLGGKQYTYFATATQGSKADSALQPGKVSNWALQPNKPAYTATEVQAIPSSQKGANSGVATLDSDGKLAVSQNRLGEKPTDAFPGDKGKTAYEHSQQTGNAHGLTKADLELSKVNNTADTEKPISTTQQAALDNKVDKVTGKGLSANDLTGTLLSNYNTAHQRSHEHSNKATLDSITDTVKLNYDSVVGAKHTHDNKAVIDLITNEVKQSYDTAVTEKHTHSNKDTLESINSAVKAEYDDTASKKHTHNNAEVLNATEASFTLEEKQKLSSLENPHYKGHYVDYQALLAKHSTAVDGDYAHVDDGGLIQKYLWDSVTQQWKMSTGGASDLTPAQVKALYEQNADTNAFTTTDKTTLQTVYTHSQQTGNVHNLTKSNIGLDKVDNTRDTEKPVSVAQQSALDNVTANLFTGVSYSGSILTLTRKNGTVESIDLELGDSITNGYYDNIEKNIVLTLSSGTNISISLQELTTDYYADDNTLELYTDEEASGKLKFKIKEAILNKIDTAFLHTENVFNPHDITAEKINAEPKIASKGSAFNKDFGDAAGTVCEGNDSRLSNPRQAIDVYTWAKEPTKPDYVAGDITLDRAIKSNVDMGGVKKGEGFSIGTSILTILTKLLSKTYAPVPDSNRPLFSISPSSISMGVGETLNKRINFTFDKGRWAGKLDSEGVWQEGETQGDLVGNITGYSITSDDAQFGTQNLGSGATYYDLTGYPITKTTTYTFKVSYGQGHTPTDSEGEVYTSPMQAGYIEKSLNISTYRRAFYGTSSSSTTPFTTSEQIWGLASKTGAVSANSTFDINIPAGTTMVIFAYPSTIRDMGGTNGGNILSLDLNQSITDNFIKAGVSPRIVSVEGAGNSIATDYKVYTFIPTGSFVQSAKYRVTL